MTAQASHSPWGAPTQGETQTVLDGVYTLDQARRGEQIYKEQCTLCHRDNLLGNTIDGGPPLRGPQFTTRWQDLSIETLLVTIEELMPMSEPGSLSRQEYVDAVSFILWANELPAGKTRAPDRHRGTGADRHDLRAVALVAYGRPNVSKVLVATTEMYWVPLT